MPEQECFINLARFFFNDNNGLLEKETPLTPQKFLLFQNDKQYLCEEYTSAYQNSNQNIYCSS
jgi:hypothetical protein